MGINLNQHSEVLSSQDCLLVHYLLMCFNISPPLNSTAYWLCNEYPLPQSTELSLLEFEQTCHLPPSVCPIRNPYAEFCFFPLWLLRTLSGLLTAPFTSGSQSDRLLKVLQQEQAGKLPDMGSQREILNSPSAPRHFPSLGDRDGIRLLWPWISSKLSTPCLALFFSEVPRMSKVRISRHFNSQPSRLHGPHALSSPQQKDPVLLSYSIPERYQTFSRRHQPTVLPLLCLRKGVGGWNGERLVIMLS